MNAALIVLVFLVLFAIVLVAISVGYRLLESQRKKQVQLASQPLARFPRLVECAIPMTACDDPETHYQFGVDLFIGGLAAIAAMRAQPE